MLSSKRGRTSLEYSATGFGYPNPGDRCGKKGSARDPKCGAEASRLRERSYGKRCDGARHTPDVIREALRGRANRRWIDLRRQRAESGEVSGAKERDER